MGSDNCCGQGFIRRAS